MSDTHTHMWGPIQTARWSGEPSRPCLDECNVISLDLYLYCESCTGPLTVNERGEYHHIDETGAILPDFNAFCTPMPETGEAPYDEDEEPAEDEPDMLWEHRYEGTTVWFGYSTDEERAEMDSSLTTYDSRISIEWRQVPNPNLRTAT